MNLNKTVRFSVGYRYDLLASPFFTIFFREIRRGADRGSPRATLRSIIPNTVPHLSVTAMSFAVH